MHRHPLFVRFRTGVLLDFFIYFFERAAAMIHRNTLAFSSAARIMQLKMIKFNCKEVFITVIQKLSYWSGAVVIISYRICAFMKKHI